jgi:bacillithiol biosynthesis deacetylase BshB1
MASILVVGPHPDDQELGMGGTIARLAQQGHRVHLLDVTDGEPTPRGSPEVRAREAQRAAEILGVGRSLLGLPNRQVVHGLESRHKMAAVIRQHRPDWVFLPYPVDAHPDHVAVTRIGEDARFDAKLTKTDIPGAPHYPKRISYYYCTHLRMSFSPTFCVDISAQLDAKMRAIGAYESQFGHDPSIPSMVRTMDEYFGGRIGTVAAEPFYTHEVLGFGGLDQLL